MKQPLYLSIILTLISLASCLVYPSFNGNQAFELSGNSTDVFNLEAQTWTASRALTTNITTICGNTLLLGGYGVLSYEGYFEKSYSGLTTHKSISYEIQVFIIDNWLSTDSLILQFDDVNQTVAWDISQIVARTATATNVCGQSGAKDLQYLTLMGGVSHTANTLRFRIISKVNQSPTQASFGVRNISLIVNPKDPSDMCYRSGDNIATGAPGECPCTVNFFTKSLNPVSCKACDASCLDCFDSHNNECLQCRPGYSFTSAKKCEKCAATCGTCSGPNQDKCITCAQGYWLQSDGTCAATCSLPVLYSQQVGDFKVCKTVCTTGQYAYWNGTCGASCPAPYVGQTINNDLICKLCAVDTNYFYQWNNTCGTTCLAPLVLNGQICQLPCGINDFYYPNNNSCGSVCNAPFVNSVVSGVVKQCKNPCDSNGYLLWDGTCGASCLAPHYGQNIDNILKCKLCTNDNDFYYDSNNTCGSTCPSPFVQNGQFCQLPCAANDFYYPNNNTCKSTCGGLFVSSTIFGAVKQCQSPCQMSDYLLWNGTCNSTCIAPHYGQSYSNNLFCKLCQNDGDFYFDWNNTCGSTCPSPYVTNGQFCKLPCDVANFYYPNNNTCGSVCNVPFVSSVVFGVIKQCKTPCNSNEYLLWNGTCGTSCPAPHYAQNSSNNLVCKLCPNSNDFYNEWKNTCGPTCPYPFVTNGRLCQLPCAVDDFYYPNNNTCSSTCASSFVNFTTFGVIQQCESPCNSNEYLLWNGTCSGSCLAPHYGQSYSNNLFCKLCQNDNDYYYDWNNSCESTCPAPLVNAIGQFCQLPCDANDFYFLNNQTCGNTCDGHFVNSVALGFLKQCESPCNSNEYLLWNGTCNDTCLAPHYGGNFDNNLYCQLCQNDNDFYYDWNNSCGSTCVSPFVTNGQFCQLPCDINDFYYPNNNTCKSTCDGLFVSSMIFNTIKQCKTPCDSNEYLFWDGTCDISCPSPHYGQSYSNNLYCKLCQNDNDFYYDWNNSCASTCPSPWVMNGQFCQLPCDISDFYYSNNNTCDSTCNSPFVTSVAFGVIKQCENPCDSNEFLFWDGACSNSCSASHYQRISSSDDLTFCDACQPGYFLFPNGTCLSQCDSPLQQTSINGSYFCDFPCSGAAQVLLRNGTCIQNCQFPMKLTTESIGDFCDYPCQGNDFLYVTNSSCLADCNSPWKSGSQNGINVCSPPCANGEFLDEDSSSCLSACHSPSITKIKNSILTCIVQSPQESPSSNELTEEFVLSTNEVTNATGKLTSVGTVVASLLSSSSPSGITLTVLVKMLKYIRYIDVNYPHLLELMLEDQGESPISMNIGFNMPQGLQKKFERKSLPKKFEKYHVPSNFIVNCWQELLTTGLVVSIMVLAVLIAHFTRKHKQISSLFKRVSKATRWNFFLLIVCSNLVEIGLFSCLQMRSISFTSFGEVFSWILSIFMSSFALFVLIQAFYIPFDLRRQRRLGKDNQRKWEDWSILFKEFKNQKFSQQSYMFFFLLRIVIFAILLGCLENHPVLQASLLSAMSVALLCFLIICRPFKQRFYLVKSLVEEGTLAFVNICVLILAIMDKTENEDEHTRAKIGDVVILINLVFNFVALGFAIIEISIRVYMIYQLVKTEKSQGVRFWKKVLLVLIEPESMEGGSHKINIKKIGSMRKVHPFHPSQSSTLSLLDSNQTDKKSVRNSSINENLDFTGSLIDMTSPNAASRENSKNLLFNGSSPSNNSDDAAAEVRNESARESTPLGEETNTKLTFKPTSISRLRPRRNLATRHYSKQELKDIIRNELKKEDWF